MNDIDKIGKVIWEFEISRDTGCFISLIPIFFGIVWSYISEKHILSVLLIFISFFIIKSIIESNNESDQFHHWLESNDRILIFFFPTQKTIQSKIKEHFENKLAKSIKHIYYSGPTLVGDISNPLFLQLTLRPINKSTPNHPKLLILDGKRIIELMDLKEILNKEITGDRVNELANQMNNYAQITGKLIASKHIELKKDSGNDRS